MLADMVKNVNDFLYNLMEVGVPEDVKRMVMSLGQEGKVALVNWYDEESNFHKYADIKNNIHHFGINTDSHMMIYHYTTVDSLEKILNSGYFRIKASDYMNDPDEFRWASKVGLSHLKEYGANHEELMAFNNMINTQPFKDSYIWSFTKNEDSQNLFNVYGDKSGVAIGFDLSDVMVLLASHNSNGKQDLLQLKSGDAFTFPLKVEYRKSEQEKYIYPVVEEWLYAYRTFKSDPYDMKQIMLCCSKNMFLFNMVFKNPVLRQEEELRFVVIRIGNGQRNPEIEVNGIPYTKCQVTRNLMKSVKLQTNNSCSIDQMKKLLNKYECNNTTVNKSNIPY